MKYFMTVQYDVDDESTVAVMEALRNMQGARLVSLIITSHPAK